jgi:hypothetical protein
MGSALYWIRVTASAGSTFHYLIYVKELPAFPYFRISSGRKDLCAFPLQDPDEKKGGHRQADENREPGRVAFGPL